MKRALITTILAASAALFSLTAHASNCDSTGINIENNLLSDLKILKMNAQSHSHINDLKEGTMLPARGSLKFTVTSGFWSHGAAEGEVILLTNKGTEIHLMYKVEPTGLLHNGNCSVKTASSYTIPANTQMVVPSSTDGKPANITFFINR